MVGRNMKYIEKHPFIMIITGIIGISVSSILVRYSQAPASVTAAWRLIWTVILMTPVVFGKKTIRRELLTVGSKTLMQSGLSGIFLALHFLLWFESLNHTSVASSTTIVCTEVIWVALGYCVFLKGKLSVRAVCAIGVTFCGSAAIALADSGGSGMHLYGDLLALAAAVAVAVYTLIGGIVRQKASTSVYTYLVYSACMITLLVVCFGQGVNCLVYGLQPVIIGLMLALFSTILGHSIFSWCLKYFSPSFVSASKLCEPVAAALMAAVLFAEMPGLLQLLGCVLILGGVYYYSVLERKNL